MIVLFIPLRLNLLCKTAVKQRKLYDQEKSQGP